MSFRAQKGAPPLSVDEVITALKDLWKRKFNRCQWIGMKVFFLSHSKLTELTSSCASKEDCLRAVVHFWLTRCPYASWRWLIWSLEQKLLLQVSEKITYAEDLTDSTLTVKNVSSVISSVSLSVYRQVLDAPQCRENELLWNGATERHKKSLVSFWLKTRSPFASWENLSGRLYYHNQQKAVKMAEQFVSGSSELAVDVNELCEILLTIGQKWRVTSHLRLLELLVSEATVSRFNKRVYIDRSRANGFQTHIRPYLENHPCLSWRDVAYAFYMTAGQLPDDDSLNCYEMLEDINRKYLEKGISLQDLCKKAILSFVEDDEDIDLLPLPKRMRLTISHSDN